ncbi:hypothetical protein P8452_66615 [Trifolium repens]|nr:hypothetical protein P8452_66615 [Trifolium repens]
MSVFQLLVALAEVFLNEEGTQRIMSGPMIPMVLRQRRFLTGLICEPQCWFPFLHADDIFIFCSISHARLLDIAALFGFHVGTIPLVYLGFPIFVGRFQLRAKNSLYLDVFDTTDKNKEQRTAQNR